jgi:hypothetical protein
MLAMTASILMLSMLFGTFGLGFVMYAKNAGKIIPAIAGGLLLFVPYFIPNVYLLAIVCLTLTALPFVFRDL